MKIFTMGGKRIGFGHIARMIPIYDAFVASGHSAKFLIQGDEAALSILDNREAELLNWMESEPPSLSTEDIILIDTLTPPIAAIKRWTKTSRHIYYISDERETGTWPFKVINWRVGASALKAKNGLYGEEFVPLRKEVLNAGSKKTEHKREVTKVIISMGASDTLNLIPKTIKILKNNLSSAYRIIVAMRSFHSEFQNLMKRKDSQVEILADLSANELFEALVQCDLAIASGGHTIYELAHLGIPVIHVRVADNQEPAKCWDETGFTFPIGRYQESNYEEKVLAGWNYFTLEKRQKASQVGRKLVDGNGAERIFRELVGLRA